MIRNSIRLFLAVGLLIFLLLPVLTAANLSGTWKFVFVTEGSEYPRTIVITQNGGSLTGRMGEETLTGAFRDGKLEMEGKHYSSEAGYSAVLKFTGVVNSGKITGKGLWDSYHLTFTAARAD